MRVLLVRAELVTARSVMHMLKANGSIVEHVNTGEECLELVRHYDYDIVLLDLMLPDMEGYEAVRRMRSNRIEVPIIILSRLTQPQAKVKAFSIGADDFVSEPFESTEMLARMQAIVRRSRGYSQPTLQVGPLQLNMDNREVLVFGQPIHLTDKEHAILKLLMLRKGMVLTKDAFFNNLYGGIDEPEAKVIDVFICKIRRKLALAGAGNLIGTVWGRGYTMHATAAQTDKTTVLQKPITPAVWSTCANALAN